MKSQRLQDAPLERILTINNVVFSPLMVATLGVLALDATTYPGFWTKVTGIPSTLFVGASLVSFCLLVLQRFATQIQLADETKLTLRLIAIATPFLVLVMTILGELETNHFPNFVFSSFHLHLGVIKQIVTFAIFLSLFHVVSSVKLSIALLPLKHRRTKYPVHMTGPIVFFVSLLMLFSTQLFAVVSTSATDMIAIVRHPFYSLEQRRRQQFGFPYLTYQFFNTNTEAKSVIAVPPQFKWGIVGNIGFSRYFMYPRFLIHPEDYQDQTLPDVDYYVIARSLQTDGKPEYEIWPPYPVPAESIILYTEELQTSEVIHTPMFDPADPIYKDKWGIIKVNKNYGK